MQHVNSTEPFYAVPPHHNELWAESIDCILPNSRCPSLVTFIQYKYNTLEDSVSNEIRPHLHSHPTEIGSAPGPASLDSRPGRRTQIDHKICIYYMRRPRTLPAQYLGNMLLLK